jgi:hypothetical protein
MSASAEDGIPEPVVTIISVAQVRKDDYYENQRIYFKILI